MGASLRLVKAARCARQTFMCTLFFAVIYMCRWYQRNQALVNMLSRG